MNLTAPGCVACHFASTGLYSMYVCRQGGHRKSWNLITTTFAPSSATGIGTRGCVVYHFSNSDCWTWASGAGAAVAAVAASTWRGKYATSATAPTIDAATSASAAGREVSAPRAGR